MSQGTLRISILRIWKHGLLPRQNLSQHRLPSLFQDLEMKPVRQGDRLDAN